MVGGMSIDLALRLKGISLYDDNTLPDYDFYSSTNWLDSYGIIYILYKTGLTDLSVINAMHQTTMRVRISGITVADCTYIPKIILDKIKFIEYGGGLHIIHPYYQYMDQHRSLSYGYENLDLDRPTIKYRWLKDMHRYDLLWQHYPLIFNQKDDSKNKQINNYKLINIKINITNIINNCVTGICGLLFWIKWATDNYKFKSKYDIKKIIGDIEINRESILFSIPIGHYLSIYTNNIENTHNIFSENYKNKSTKFYRKYLATFPRKIIIGDIEIFDIKNNWIAAYKDVSTNMHICNLQPIMLYSLYNFNFKGEYLYYICYMVSRELLEFAIKKNIYELLPTADYYGNANISDVYALSAHKFKNRKNKMIINNQPRHIYDKDLLQTNPQIDEAYKFKVEDSDIYDIDGEECAPFL